MIKVQKCLICNCNGFKILDIKYNSKIIYSFFIKYYKDKNKVKKFLYKIKNFNYTLLKCNYCKFIWQKYRLKPNLESYLYDNLINFKSSKISSNKMLKLQGKTFRRDFDFLKNYFNKKKIKSLDFGAGWGSWLYSVRNNNDEIYALELSKRRVSYLKRNKIRVISLNQLLKFKSKFDFVRVEQVLEHVNELRHVLTVLKKSTSKKCLIHVAVPNSNTLFKNHFIKNFIKKGPAQPLEHLNSFTPKSLKKLLYKYSFKRLSFLELLKILLKSSNFKLGYFRSFLKIIYNNINSTSLVVKKI